MHTALFRGIDNGHTEFFVCFRAKFIFMEFKVLIEDSGPDMIRFWISILFTKLPKKLVHHMRQKSSRKKNPAQDSSRLDWLFSGSSLTLLTRDSFHAAYIL